MIDDLATARPPAGWLHDATTGKIRWWDGSQWTEHVRLTEPMTVGAVGIPAETAAAQAVAEPMTRAGLRAAAAQAVLERPAAPFGDSGAAYPPIPPRVTYQGAVTQPRPRASQPYQAPPATSKNGAAKASLILLVLLTLGVASVVWLPSGMDPAVLMIVRALNVLAAIAAFALAIVGLTIAFRRPTKKLGSVVALVLSTVGVAVVLVAMRL